ncbi:hypothetical protein U5N28_09880 [Lysinibacillus telephonicus]|uniref:Uncharacterized protein n=1 Tax=Lysinibacillus telephonicus TaxID=1714840 RepID=A0A3S0JKX5_9BACI|nr:hypothetical protein [Lysinibacillus telephonicus]RTQ90390.1 hypothetical protein EKG35_15010 [Lysinibacillus telephonicus]
MEVYTPSEAANFLKIRTETLKKYALLLDGHYSFLYRSDRLISSLRYSPIPNSFQNQLYEIRFSHFFAYSKWQMQVVAFDLMLTHDLVPLKIHCFLQCYFHR